MAFTAAYWTLGALKPNLIAFLGCDMIYGATMGESNHFYGHGTSDPLRSDITLQSLEAKSIRFMAVANSLNCAVVNLSELPKSRLAFPRVFRKDLLADGACQRLLAQQKSVLQSAKVNQAMAAEKNLGYMASSGKYWEQLENFDAAKLSQIDDMWLQVFDVTSEAAPPTR